MSARETVSSVAPTGPDTRGSGSTVPHGEVGRGTLLGFAAYGLWGLFPLYFDALKPAGPWEILANRILWTMLFCVVVLLLRRDLAWIGPLLRRPKLLAGTAVAFAVRHRFTAPAGTPGSTHRDPADPDLYNA